MQISGCSPTLLWSDQVHVHRRRSLNEKAKCLHVSQVLLHRHCTTLSHTLFPPCDDRSQRSLPTSVACSPHQASPANIYWERDIVDGEDLYRRLQDTEVIMRQPQGLPLRLLIIDSITHLFRDIGDHTDASAYVRRTGMLFRLSALLRRFADTYNLAVVVTNQVHHCSLTHAISPADFILLLLMLLLHCITCLTNCICKQTIPTVSVG